MLLDLWPTLEACWGADFCAGHHQGGGSTHYVPDRVPKRRKRRQDTDEEILAVLGLL